ncbi:hypothetical protein [Bradyrhizobium arachidis]|uniref:hypothetical protein n=1 Tax=Bradyrhizobium arachidis TaxID=858423 RepID=UPI0011608731|nr:hypothetical protein [Bradyrhizobium arachidis]
MITERDKRQLAAIIAIVKPAHSLAARLDELTNEQRSCYAEWRASYEKWIERCRAQCPEDDDPDACLYCRSLEDEDYGPTLPRENYEPKLRRDVRIALYGLDKFIWANATEEEAERIYKDYCDEQR